MNSQKEIAHIRFKNKIFEAKLYLKQQVIKKQIEILDEYRSEINRLRMINRRLKNKIGNE